MKKYLWFAILGWGFDLLAFISLIQVDSSRVYNLSLYTQLPVYFWCLILASISAHLFAAVPVATKRFQTNHSLTILISSLLGLILSSIAVILLPYILGYYSLRGDFSTHLTRSMEIASQSNLSTDVFYPALYGLIQIIHVFTGVGLREIWFFGAVSTYLLHISLVILIIRDLTHSNRYALWAGLIAAIPIAGTYLRTINPAQVAVNILIPLVFYLYINSRRRIHLAVNFMLILVILILAFFHPLVAIMYGFWLTILEITLWLIQRSPRDISNEGLKFLRPHNPIVNITPSLIIAITWITWVSSFSVWQRNLRAVIDWLVGESQTQITKMSILVERSNLPFMEAAVYAFKQTNGLIIFALLALISYPWFFLISKLSSRHLENRRYFLSLYVLLLFSILVSIFVLVGPFGSIDYFRFARFMIPWTWLLIALVPMNIEVLDKKLRRLIVVILIILLIGTATGGILALHPSPFVFKPNDQLTLQELSCMRWISKYGDGLPVKGIWSVKRLAEASLGIEAAASDVYSRTPLPDHFGYDQYPELSKSVSESSYIIITNSDRQAVLNLWMTAEKFSPGDFQKLQSDPSIALVYQNPECEVWGVYPDQKQALP